MQLIHRKQDSLSMNTEHRINIIGTTFYKLTKRLVTFQKGFTDFINGHIKCPQQNCDVLRLFWIKNPILLIRGWKNLSPQIILWSQI